MAANAPDDNRAAPNWSGRRVMVVRPGALGDALLTLPVFAQLVRCGAELAAILGAPASFAWMPSGSGLAGLAAAPKVADFGGREWLGLFGGSFGPAARQVLAAVDTAILFLQDDARGRCAADTLLSAGLSCVVLAPPPTRDARGAPHAATRLAEGVFGPTACDPGATSAGGYFGSLPWLLPTAAEAAAADALAAELGLDPAGPPPVFLHPGSGGVAKALPVAVSVALLAQLRAQGHPVVVSEGPADSMTVATLAGAAGVAGLTMPPVLRHLPLRLLLALFRRGSVVAPDCGIAHLAAPVAPLAVWFGPTDPTCWRPLGPRVGVVSAPSASANTAAAEAAARLLIEALGCTGGRGFDGPAMPDEGRVPP